MVSCLLIARGVQRASYLFVPPNLNPVMIAVFSTLAGLLGLLMLLVFTFVIQLIRAPYRQRDEARIRITEMEAEKEKGETVLGIIGAIEHEIVKGKELLEKLKHAPAFDIYLKGEYDRWFDEVGEYLQRKQYSEYAPWVNAAYTDNKASLNDLVRACDQGLNQLVDLHRRLTNSSTPHKKG